MASFALSLPLAALSYASYVGCGRQWSGTMMGSSVQTNSNAKGSAEFTGLTCGASEYTAGTSLTARANVPGEFVLELSGGATFVGGNAGCPHRVVNRNDVTVDTSAAIGPVTLRVASANGYQQVHVSVACTLAETVGPPRSPAPPFPPPSPPLSPGPGKKMPSALYALHGLMMALAWLVLAPCGMAISRYVEKSAASVRLHRNMMLLVCALTIAGVITSFSMKTAAHMQSDHSKLGIAVLAIVLLQILLGLFRPAKHKRAAAAADELKGYETPAAASCTTPSTSSATAPSPDYKGSGAPAGEPGAAGKTLLRRVWEKVHQLLGWSLLGLAMASCVTGAAQSDLRYGSDSVQYILALALIGLWALALYCVELWRCVRSPRNGCTPSPAWSPVSAARAGGAAA